MQLLNLALNCNSLKVFLEHYVAHANMLKKPIWVFVLQKKELHLQRAVTVASLETWVSPSPWDEGAKAVWKPAHVMVTSHTACMGQLCHPCHKIRKLLWRGWWSQGPWKRNMEPTSSSTKHTHNSIPLSSSGPSAVPPPKPALKNIKAEDSWQKYPFLAGCWDQWFENIAQSQCGWLSSCQAPLQKNFFCWWIKWFLSDLFSHGMKITTQYKIDNQQSTTYSGSKGSEMLTNQALRDFIQGL